MFAKVKSQTFIDTLVFEFMNVTSKRIKAILIDDKGMVCSSLETEINSKHNVFQWEGLNDLPYGVYTLELSQGKEEQKMRLVKRI